MQNEYKQDVDSLYYQFLHNLHSSDSNPHMSDYFLQYHHGKNIHNPKRIRSRSRAWFPCEDVYTL